MGVSSLTRALSHAVVFIFLSPLFLRFNMELFPSLFIDLFYYTHATEPCSPNFIYDHPFTLQRAVCRPFFVSIDLEASHKLDF